MSLEIILREPTKEDLKKAEVKSTSKEIIENIKYTPISNEEVEEILKKVDEIPQEDISKDFFKREESLKVPRKGAVIQQNFPPKINLKPPDRIQKEKEKNLKELKVLRYMPEGNVSVATHCIVTFNQPIIPLSSLGDLEKLKKKIPIEISPKVKGKWRWLGTQTVKFIPKHRFPKSTDYTVKISKRIKSQANVELKEDFEFKFSLPEPSVEHFFPNNNYFTGNPALDKLDPNPLLFVQFDQKIKPKQVFEKIKDNENLTIISKKEVKRILEENEELKRKRSSLYNKYLYYLKIGKKRQHFWMKYKKPLLYNSNNDVVFEEGLIGSEGPKPTKKLIPFCFRTYGKFCVTSNSPNRKKDGIMPRRGRFHVFFSNNIEQDDFNTSCVKIEPPIEKLKVIAQGNSLQIEGDTKAREVYKISIFADKIKDIYDQVLDKDTTVTTYSGACNQCFQSFFKNIQILDPILNDPHFSVVTVNVQKIHLCVFQITPEQSFLLPWTSEYYEICGNSYYPKKLSDHMISGKLVFDEIVPTNSLKDEIHEFKFDLTKFLQFPKQKLGQIVVIAEPCKSGWKGRYSGRPIIKTWIQCTNLAVDVYSSPHKELIGLVSNLNTGKIEKVDFFANNTILPHKKSDNQRKRKEILEIVENLKIQKSTKKFKTDETGLCSLNFQENSRATIWARKKNDICVVKDVQLTPLPLDSVVWFVFNDRGLYKPKEKVSLKGILRSLKFKGKKRLLEYPGKKKILYKVVDSRGNDFIKDKEIVLSEFGSFFIEFELPDGVNLGDCRVEFSFVGDKTILHSHSFKIEEFRVPEFKSSVKIPDKIFIVNNLTVATVTAEYYSGGGLPGSVSRWIVKQEKTKFIPPNFTFKGFTFTCKNYYGRNDYSPPQRLNGKTDINGSNQCCIEINENIEKKNSLKYPSLIKVDCGVQDINLQTINASSSFICHPSSLYAGLKLEEYYCNIGDKIPVSCIVVNVDGKIIENINVLVEVKKRTYEFRSYEWVTKEELHKKCEFKSNSTPIQLDLIISECGDYIVYAKVFDENGLENNCCVQLYVKGGIVEGKKNTSIKKEVITLIENKKEYKVGEECKIFVSSPLKSPQEGIIMCYANGYKYARRFSFLSENSGVLSIPIVEEFIPSMCCRVFCVGVGDRIDNTGEINKKYPKRTSYAQGSKIIRVPPKNVLSVKVIPKKSVLSPGEKSHVSVEVSGLNSEKSESLVTLVIVDDAILQLTGYKIPDPIKTFFFSSHSSSKFYHSRDKLLVKDWSRLHFSREYQKSFSDYALDCLEGIVGFFGRSKCYKNCSDCCRQETCCPGDCLDLGIPSESACNWRRCRDHVRCKCCFGGCLGGCPEQQGLCDIPSGDCGGFSTGKSTKHKRGMEIRTKNVCMGGDVTKLCFGGKGKKMGGKDSSPVKIVCRTIFKPLVVFLSDVKIPQSGKIEIPFDLPDNLTKFRIFAVATNSSDYFGIGESSIQVKLPLAVRPSLNRFLNFGDKTNFSVVLVNQTEEELEVKVASRLRNLKFINEDIKGFKAIIPTGKRCEMKFPVEPIKCGKGKFQVCCVSSSNFSDSVIKEINIYSPCTSEAFATYGTVDKEKEIFVQPVLPPSAQIFSEFGGVNVTFSSTALQALTDSFLYIYNYDFDCLEQISSRILSICALEEFLEQFNVPQMPKKSDFTKVINFGIKQLSNCQKWDGSFGFWSILSSSNVYLSIHIAHCVIRLIESGYKEQVPENLSCKCKGFIFNVARFLPIWYNKCTKASLKAFSLYVLTLFVKNKVIDEKKEIEKICKMALTTFKTYEKILSLEGKSWILFTLSQMQKLLPNKKAANVIKRILNEFSNKVDETSETAHFITSYADDGQLVMLHSNTRTDAVILESLMYADPKNDLIVKIVKGLLKRRVKGRWRSTNECVHVLMSLKKYFLTYEKVVPDFCTKIWLDEDFGGSTTFQGREINFKQIDVPMNYLVKKKDENEKEKKKKDLVLLKEGKGRMYYRIGLSYAPKDFNLKELDHGFIVHRSYEFVNKKTDVEFQKQQKKWLFKAGELIRVKLKLINCAVRYHVALVDFIPSGCEILNPDLKTTGPIPPKKDEKEKDWYSRTWYEHQNLRDERVEVFTSYLYCGEHEYSYVMRATSVGEFIVPPAKCFEMYSEETFGRTKTEKVEIFEKQIEKKEEVKIEEKEKKEEKIDVEED